MDHVLVPLNQVRPTPRVRYYCMQVYDGGDFLTYPSRMGWTEKELFDISTWEKLGKPGKRSTAEASAFLQQWLFFGLLSAIFGGSFRLQDFVDGYGSDKEVKHVHTRSLLALAGKYKNNDASASHVEKCLFRAYSIYNFIASVETIDPYLLLSIGLLGEFFCSTWLAGSLAGAKFFDLAWNTPSTRANLADGDYPPPRSGRHDLLSYEMANAGWCPRQVNLSTTFGQLDTRYFVSQLQRANGKSGSHSRCTYSICEAFNINKSSYSSVHTQTCRGCDFLSIDARELDSIILEGKVPVVTLDDGDQGISLGRSDSSVGYVAISHVWSDGLGNPLTNAMPRCQLEDISNLVARIFAKENGPCRVPFWMDTLCCPTTSGKTKKMALKEMRNVYLKASRVLVLDSGLRSIESSGRSVKELAHYIYVSSWASRLWTLQEGISAKSLYVQFADDYFDFQLVGAQVKDDGSEHALERISRYIWGVSWLRAGDSHQHTHSLPDASTALQTRSTSVEQDEALCLGSILGVNMAPIVEAEPNARMKALWSTLSEVPRSLFFWTESRLADQGFRWAPQSLLGCKQRIIDDLDVDPPAAAIVEHGLKAEVYCIDIPSLRTPLRHPIRDYLLVRGTDGNCNYMLSFTGTGFSRGGDGLDRFAIPEGTFSRVAILTSESLTEGNTQVVIRMVIAFAYADEDGVTYARRGPAGTVFLVRNREFLGAVNEFVDTTLAQLNTKSEAVSMEGDNYLVHGAYTGVVGTVEGHLQKWCID